MLKNKYRNKKVYVGDMKFDSKKEYRRFVELREIQRQGKIYDLRRQVSFVLIDKSEYGRAIKYVADFTFRDSGGSLHVEDVKSHATAKNPVYRLKFRLMQERYGITVEEV